ncbi:MAG: hypothetical protein NT062_14715 [Proteobacteria bacterium]|nr:hypothetical protein [Pseudomonadota bacterium]
MTPWVASPASATFACSSPVTASNTPIDQPPRVLPVSFAAL